MSKHYFVCDKCGNPIENLNEFLLQWKHSTGSNKSYSCHIVHESCKYDPINLAVGTIICERNYDELKTKTKLIEWITSIQKLNLAEHVSFLNCLKRLLSSGDIKL